MDDVDLRHFLRILTCPAWDKEETNTTGRFDRFARPAAGRPAYLV